MPAVKVKVDKRSLIVAEGAKLFKEKGFAATSMREIAERVGMEAASMYNHIRSKEEILEAVCFDTGKKYNEHLQELLKQTNDCAAIIEATISFHVELILESGDCVSVLNNEWRSLGEEKTKLFKKMRNEYEKNLGRLITKGVEQGVFKNLNVSICLFTLLSALRWVELWYKPGRSVRKEDLTKNIISLLMTGMKAE